MYYSFICLKHLGSDLESSSEDDWYYEDEYNPYSDYYDERLQRQNLRADKNESSTNDTVTKPKEKQLEKLMDLAAIETAKHYSCEEIESHNPPLDETLLKKVTKY